MSAQNIKKANVDREFSASSSVRMKEAAEKYRVAMSDEKSRDQLIEDYLPLVKSTVSRMRFHFPDHYDIEDMYGIAVKALIVSVNQFSSTFSWFFWLTSNTSVYRLDILINFFTSSLFIINSR